MFSYGVYPILEENGSEDWVARAKKYMKTHELKGSCLIKAESPSPAHPDMNHKMEIIELQWRDYEDTGT